MACHSIINPLGFSLEHYDAIGRWQTEDKDKPVDTASDYTTHDDAQVRIKSIADVARIAADSPAGHRAFVTHLFHHLVRRPARADGPDTLESLVKRFASSNYNIQELVVHIATLTASHTPSDPS